MSDLREQRRYDFIFKIAVVGPDDFLNDQVLHLISGGHIGLDGLQIHVGNPDCTERIKLSYWLPHKDAFKILISLSYRGAHGALVVLGQEDIETLAQYHAKIKKECGEIPISHLLIGKNMTSEEISKMADLKMRELTARIRERVSKEF